MAFFSITSSQLSQIGSSPPVTASSYSVMRGKKEFKMTIRVKKLESWQNVCQTLANAISKSRPKIQAVQ